MTREQAAERLKSIKAKVELYDDVLALRMGVEALSVEPMRWIPVSERGPEETGYYLTTRYSDCFSDTTEVQEARYETGIEDDWFDELENITWAVLAWMPLPKPYESEEQE